jgi:NTE family protein
MRQPTLVIAGGALKGFGMLGAIQYIHEQFGIENIHSFFGTSVGTIIGYVLSIGQTPLETIHSVISSKILHTHGDINLEQLLSQQGVFSFEPIQDELELITLSKHGQLFTMKSLYEILGKELCCVTVNFTTGKPEILHHTTTPDLPCLTAIQMSCSIPLLFNQMIYNDMIYIDGGLSDNFPIRVAYRFGKTDIIGICSNTELDSDDDQTETFKMNWVKLIFLPINIQTRKTIRKYRKRCTIVDVPLLKSMFNRFHLDTPEIMEMFSIGYTYGQKNVTF